MSFTHPILVYHGTSRRDDYGGQDPAQKKPKSLENKTVDPHFTQPRMTDFSSSRHGMYLFTDYKWAYDWAVFAKAMSDDTPIVNTYTLEPLEGLRVWDFGTEASEKWKQLITWSYSHGLDANNDHPEFKNYDVIIGPVSYGVSSNGTADLRNKTSDGTWIQIALFTDKALEKLHYKKEEIVSRPY